MGIPSRFGPRTRRASIQSRRETPLTAIDQGDGPLGENLDKAKGRVKQAAGDLTDNDQLKNEGKGDELAGKVKGAVDTLRDKADDAIDKIKDKIDRN